MIHHTQNLPAYPVTVAPGEIVSVEGGMASVKPDASAEHGQQWPVVHDCHIVSLAGGSQTSRLDMNVKPGDRCLLILSGTVDRTAPVCIPYSPAGSSGDVRLVHGSDTVILSGGGVTIRSGFLRVSAPSIQLNGSVTVQGNLAVSGSMMNNGVNVGGSHTHGGVETGNKRTGGPA